MSVVHYIITCFELRQLCINYKKMYLLISHHVKITKQLEEDNEHDGAVKKQVVRNTIPAGGNHMYAKQ